MKIKLLFAAICATIAFSSCRKHDCVCATDTYDSNGYYVSTQTSTQKVKGFTTLKAAAECSALGDGYYKSCYLK